MVVLPVANSHESYEVKPTKIIALGLNYNDHVEESKSILPQDVSTEVPTEPILFAKTPNCLTGPDQPIYLPRILSSYNFENLRTDYEGELAVIIGWRCKDLSEDEAMEYVWGYTCTNDVSQRNIQTGDRSGWFRGKSFDTFGPVGPVVVRKENIPDPHNLKLTTRLNGKVVQESNTSFMIFNIPQTVSFVSRNFTLEPGDLILTGTPSGVGPMNHGDTVEVEVEKIGVLRNPVIDPAKEAGA